jgi:hypothetical protein
MVEINEMKIRVPDMSESGAATLGRAVSEGMAYHFNDSLTTDKTIGSINIQLKIDNNVSEADLTEMILERLMQQLNQI